MKEWIISNKQRITFLVLIFLISTVSFALGFLVGRDQSRAPIIIEKMSK